MGDLKENMSKNILLLRKRMGITQTQLAEKAGVKTTSVSSWERGANLPEHETLIKLCEIFQVTPNDLYGEPITENQTESAILDFYEIDKTNMELEHIDPNDLSNGARLIARELNSLTPAEQDRTLRLLRYAIEAGKRDKEE